MSELVKLGALWKGEDKDGKTMLTGVIGDARLLVLQNNFKEAPKHPDYVVYVAKKEKKEDNDSEVDAGQGGGAF